MKSLSLTSKTVRFQHNFHSIVKKGTAKVDIISSIRQFSFQHLEGKFLEQLGSARFLRQFEIFPL